MHGFGLAEKITIRPPLVRECTGTRTGLVRYAKRENAGKMLQLHNLRALKHAYGNRLRDECALVHNRDIDIKQYADE